MATCQKLEEFTKGAVIPCTLFFNTFLEHLLEPCYGAEEDFWSNLASQFLLMKLNHMISIKYWRKSDKSKCEIDVFVPVLHPAKTENWYKEVSVIWTNEYELLSLTRYYPTISWKIALMSSHLLWDQNQEVSTYYFVSRPASA